MCVTPRNKGLPFFPASSPFMSTTAGGVFPVVKPQIPFPSPAPDWTGLRRRSPPPAKTLTLAAPRPWRGARRPSLPTLAGFPHHLPSPFPSLRWRSLNPLSGAGVVSAGRSKKKAGGPSTGRIEGNAEVRRRAKEGARKRSRRMAENLFYRHSKTWGDEADSFTEEELEMIGLGYDRQVRFMEKDDPKLRHPDDWYKYGQYGPYSWRGIVVGSPIRGRFSDERVTIIGEVRDHEEWEQIERFEMASDFSQRLESMDHRLGLQYFWVFVRHPKWRSSDLPWQQWTLVSEVALEAGNQRRDKWSLMGRLGNNSRALITQCAAWMRPDIIYVRRPVYQCRFEPQENFFRLLGPLLDPDTEDQFVCELKVADGKVETCTYFAGLCKIVRINPKAFVDDVVEAYQRLSDEGKSRCLEFLLTNHPMELLHPYTKEWKTRLEEMELGCDAPDGSDGEEEDDGEMVDWIEDDGGDEEGEEDLVIDVEEGEDDEVLGAGGSAGEVSDPEESEEYWNEQWKRAMKDPDAMEGLVKRSIEVSDQVYKNQNPEEERSWGDEQTPEEEEEEEEEEGSRFSPAEGREWRPRRRIKKSRIPPELFLRAAVRPFTYRNLVKEIVLMRHALVEKEITLNQ